MSTTVTSSPPRGPTASHRRGSGFQGTYKYTLPDGVPLLGEQDSFARLLRRATHRDPDRRFGSAGKMAGQLTGVLR